MNAKQVLLKHGKIAEITRGRISADNHSFLAGLVANGEKIEGYEPKVSTKPTGEKVNSNSKSVATGEKVIADFSLRYPLDTPAYYIWKNLKKSVSMRECCGNCRVSLVQCTCGAPMVVAPDGSGSLRVIIGAS